MKILLICLLALFGVGASAPGNNAALRIQADPDDYVFANKVTRDRTIYDVLIQNLWISNDGDQTLDIQSVTLSILSGKNVLAEKRIETAEIRSFAEQGYQLDQSGALDLYDFQFRAREKKAAGAVLASSEELSPSESILLIHQYLTLPSAPDAATIEVHALDESGASVVADLRLDILTTSPASDFVFPLQGVSYVAAGPDARGHHRWNVASEFAMDIVKLADNSASLSGPPDRNASYHVYGAPVRAVADGTVVAARSDVPEDESLLRQPGESLDAHQARIAAEQTNLLLEGADRIAGNFIVIEHDGERYSQYAHLRPGSVRVEVGALVHQGEVIGEVGNSGNSTEPHLHFQVTDGPDFLYARGLPVAFAKVLNPWADLTGETLLTGDIIHAD